MNAGENYSKNILVMGYRWITPKESDIVREIVLDFLRHPAINSAYFAHKLYGTIKQDPQFYKCLRGKKEFDNFEIHRLKDLIMDFYYEII